MVTDFFNLESSGNRETDANGFLHVKNCVLTKADVNDYWGKEIPDWENLGLNPNEVYQVFRPPEEIEKSLEQMNDLPILDEHDEVHDAAHPTSHKRIGCIGSRAEWHDPEARNSLTFWNKNQIDELENGGRNNLSMGYEYTPKLENGIYRGKKYNVRMNDIHWNHVALVDKGRVEGAMVADKARDESNQEILGKMIGHKINVGKEKGKSSPEYKRLDAGVKKFERDRDMGKDAETKPMTPIGTKKKPGKGRYIPAIPKYEELRPRNDAEGTVGKIALSRRPSGDREMQTKRKVRDADPEERMDIAEARMRSAETPGEREAAREKLLRSSKEFKEEQGDAEIERGGTPEEEIKENRVIAGIKALVNEFDNTHEEAGIDPGVTDEEQAVLDRIRDWMDAFHQQGSEDEEAGTSMDPMDSAEDEQWEDIERPKSPTGDRKRKGMDAATIRSEIRKEFAAKEKALDECSDLVGSVQKARALDSAADVYAYALRNNGIVIPKSVNLSGLQGMVQMLKQSRVGDSISVPLGKPTGVDAQVVEMISNSPYAPRV